MAANFALLAAILLVAGMAAAPAPVAYGQLPGGLGGLLGLVRISGVVLCSANATAATAAPPVFANALVQLKCGGAVVSSATTNGSGVFSILMDPITAIVSSILNNNCKLVVNTPLSTCSADLPSTGLLQSALTVVGTVQGLLPFLSIVPAGFTLAQ